LKVERPHENLAVFGDARMLTNERKDITSKEAQRWVGTPYYNAVEAIARSQWESIILPFLYPNQIDFSRILELAVGHGRMTPLLLERADHVVAADILKENIEFCQNRFAGEKKLTLICNSGTDLKEIPDESITFGFCWDSMVHFDPDVVRSYLGEFRRVLKPGAFAFCHHSNRTKNPIADWQKMPHARNVMSAEFFELFADKEGLKVVKQKVINWGRGERLMPNLDCLSLLKRP
jgi:ubiquinone/menaquinone biosynthesis C-methylase UbiE